MIGIGLAALATLFGTATLAGGASQVTDGDVITAC